MCNPSPIRLGFRPAYDERMTEFETPSAPPKRTKHVNTQATSRSLRHLAREAAEGGERLVDIARRMRIAGSTLHHWAKEDGFRRKDVRARASLAHGPRLTGTADYPELKEMAPRARLARMQELAGMARLRAVAAIEEGFLDYGLKWLREAQKLERGRKALRDYLADYPPPEEEVEEEDAWDQLDEDALAEAEGREPERLPPPPPPTPREAEEAALGRKIDAAIEAARLERMIEARGGRMPTASEIGDDRVANFRADLEEHLRLKEEARKWRLFPGRGDPPPLRAVSRGRSILPQPEPEIPGGKKLYGIEEACPVKFTRRE